MKVKTSVTLSAGLVDAIDQYRAKYGNRSAFLEAAGWAFLRQLVREAQDAKDLTILNKRAEQLNAEAADVLAYQVDL